GRHKPLPGTHALPLPISCKRPPPLPVLDDETTNSCRLLSPSFSGQPVNFSDPSSPFCSGRSFGDLLPGATGRPALSTDTAGPRLGCSSRRSSEDIRYSIF